MPSSGTPGGLVVDGRVPVDESCDGETYTVVVTTEGNGEDDSRVSVGVLVGLPSRDGNDRENEGSGSGVVVGIPAAFTSRGGSDSEIEGSGSRMVAGVPVGLTSRGGNDSDIEGSGNGMVIVTPVGSRGGSDR